MQLQVQGCWPLSCSQGQSRRGITADARPSSSEELSEQDYHRISDLTLAEIMNTLEPIIEDSSLREAELEYSEVHRCCFTTACCISQHS